MLVIGTIHPAIAFLQSSGTVHRTNIRACFGNRALFPKQIQSKALKAVQTTINQRIKFLLEHFGMSARSFSRVLGVPDNNTQNYIGPSAALPKADYLEKIMLHFKSISPLWLLTGAGEPFLPGAELEQNVSVKKNKGNIIGTNLGTVAHTYTNLADCEKEVTHLRAQIELLRDQVATKDALIAAKDEMLTLLRSGRPN